jgi:hypothetical protein
MSVPDNGNGRNGVKTIGIRFQPDLHAQLSLIAQLRDSSLQDEVSKAVEAHISASKTDPQLLQKVEQAQAEIELHAKQRRATIATLFDPPAPEPAAPAPAPAPAPAKPTKAPGRSAASQQ